jgi:predicted DNA-binding transcriptional regulator YafY
LRLPLLGAGLRPLRAKLLAAFPARQRSLINRLRTRILIGQAASEAVRASWRSLDARQMLVLQEAFMTSRVIQFQYLSREAQVTTRCVEPQYLLLNYPAWYLLALDRQVDAGRTFRLDGVQRIQILQTVFAPVSPESLRPDIGGWFQSL